MKMKDEKVIHLPLFVLSMLLGKMKVVYCH